MKRGRISKKEGRTIERLINSATVEDIAIELGRSVEAVEDYIKRELKVGLSKEEEAAYSLEHRPYWTELKAQFTDDELNSIHGSKQLQNFKILVRACDFFTPGPFFFSYGGHRSIIFPTSSTP